MHGAVAHCAFCFLSVARKSARENIMYTFTNRFTSNNDGIEFLKTNMMGSNAMRISEELASYLNIDDSTRILD